LTSLPRRPGVSPGLASCLLVLAVLASPAAAQDRSAGGETTYRRACAACHGADGTGLPQSVVGFDLELPDFTDCRFATREPDGDWIAIATAGGPVRRFDRMMPAFGDALSDEEIAATIDHIRTFCSNRSWPRGELNVPRALFTEKAYPEDEALLTASIAATGPGQVITTAIYEKRFGPRSQVELKLPVATRETGAGDWAGGVGDVAVAVKHALWHSSERGAIISVAGEVVLPTGHEARGLGKGVTVFEPFVAAGLLLPADSFVQVQSGFELPVDRARAEPEAFWRTAFGRTFTQGRFGRSWSPMVELLGARELAAGERVTWDVVPQMQVTLNTRQHIMLNGGVRVPVNARPGRATSIMVYVLWDWFDGGLFDGW
jgi:mono/diheme cytochrome c family protein